jgi:hypothetical protein
MISKRSPGITWLPRRNEAPEVSPRLIVLRASELKKAREGEQARRRKAEVSVGKRRRQKGIAWLPRAPGVRE